MRAPVARRAGETPHRGESTRDGHAGCDWSIIHAASTTLPLKAGNNVVYVHPPHNAILDAADIDVIHVTNAGQGAGPSITPVVGAN